MVKQIVEYGCENAVGVLVFFEAWASAGFYKHYCCKKVDSCVCVNELKSFCSFKEV